MAPSVTDGKFLSFSNLYLHFCSDADEQAIDEDINCNFLVKKMAIKPSAAEPLNWSLLNNKIQARAGDLPSWPACVALARSDTLYVQGGAGTSLGSFRRIREEFDVSPGCLVRLFWVGNNKDAQFFLKLSHYFWMLKWPHILNKFYVHFVTHQRNCYERSVEVLTNYKTYQFAEVALYLLLDLGQTVSADPWKMWQWRGWWMTFWRLDCHPPVAGSSGQLGWWQHCRQSVGPGHCTGPLDTPMRNSSPNWQFKSTFIF